MPAIPVIQLGLGGVGRALVQQIIQQRDALARRYGVELTYLALVDSSGALHTGAALPGAILEEAVVAKGQGRPLSAASSGRTLDDWRTLLPTTPTIIIDTTASDGQEQRFYCYGSLPMCSP